jgi:hypothetical protein
MAREKNALQGKFIFAQRAQNWEGGTTKSLKLSRLEVIFHGQKFSNCITGAIV